MSFKDLPESPLPETASAEAVQAAMDAAVKPARKAAKAASRLTAATATTTEAVAADVAGAIEATVDQAAATVAASPVSPTAPSAEAASTPTKGLFSMATAAPTAQAMFGDINDRAKGMMEKTARMGEDMVELTKGNVEAMVASARVAAKGTESLAQDAAEYGKKSLENATAAMKSFAAVKSPTELFQLQSDYARTAFDSAVAEASKFSEAMLKLAGEVAQPLSTRYAVASEKLKVAAPTAL